jgi:single-strand DNA-binding protein
MTLLDGRGEGESTGGGDSGGFRGTRPSDGGYNNGGNSGGGARRPSNNAPAFESGGMDDDIPF